MSEHADMRDLGWLEEQFSASDNIKYGRIALEGLNKTYLRNVEAFYSVRYTPTAYVLLPSIRESATSLLNEFNKFGKTALELLDGDTPTTRRTIISTFLKIEKKQVAHHNRINDAPNKHHLTVADESSLEEVLFPDTDIRPQIAIPYRAEKAMQSNIQQNIRWLLHEPSDR